MLKSIIFLTAVLSAPYVLTQPAGTLVAEMAPEEVATQKANKAFHEDQVSKGLATDAAPGTPEYSSWWCASFKDKGTCFGDDRVGCKWEEKSSSCLPEK